ncbi:zinc finger protein 628-like [Anguilla rostrata]|uniref:zinc finger protein 628-like n=1 Tax=Anguilla rostrata TaxID=7938 RepID=UPI0030CB55CA
MSDVAGNAARNAFNAQLASVMESLLAAAVCEISRIFEGSLSDSRAEAERSREEVTLLNRKLEALEGRLKEAGEGAGVTFDPSSFALAPDAGFGAGACLSGGPQVDPQRGGDEAGQVKDELQVTELESVSFFQDGAELDRVHVKEESAVEDPEPRPVEGKGREGAGAPGVSAHLRPASDASLAGKRTAFHLHTLTHPTAEQCVSVHPTAAGDGTVRWTVVPGAGPGPVLAQKPAEGPAAAGLGCVPHQPLPSRPGCVAKGWGNTVLSGDAAGGSGHGVRTRLSPAPSHAHRNGHAHRPAHDHAPKSALSCAHRPVPGQRTAPDHTHRPPPAAPEGAPTNGWAGKAGVPCLVGREAPVQPVHPPPGGQLEGLDPEVGFVRSPYSATNSVPAVQRYHLSPGGALRGGRPNTCPVAKVKLKAPLSAVGRERPYSCPYCGKAFFYPSQQRRHLLRHTGERLHPCAQCEKSFVTPSELSVHVRVHTGEKPYACLHCGKRFNRTGNLRAHERDVHLGKRPFSCAECGKTFAQKGNLRTHQQRVHQSQRHLPSTERERL